MKTASLNIVPTLHTKDGAKLTGMPAEPTQKAKTSVMLAISCGAPCDYSENHIHATFPLIPCQQSDALYEADLSRVQWCSACTLLLYFPVHVRLQSPAAVHGASARSQGAWTGLHPHVWAQCEYTPMYGLNVSTPHVWAQCEYTPMYGLNVSTPLCMGLM